MLPWSKADIIQMESCKVAIVTNLIRVLLETEAYLEADDNLWVLKNMTASAWFNPDSLARRAVCSLQSGNRSRTQEHFLKSLVFSTLRHGLWHRSTLDTFLHWGRVLKSWGQHASAVRLLETCSLGFSYSFGSSHPPTERAVRELQSCENASASVQNVLRFIRSRDQKRVLSLALEYHSLTTLIDILKPAVYIDFAAIERTIKEMRDNKCSWLQTQRLLAQCAFEQDKPAEAYEILRKGRDGYLNGDKVDKVLMASDLARYEAHANVQRQLPISQSSIPVFAALEDFSKEESHQVKAIHRRLASHGLTHFARNMIFADPPLVTELNGETLGWGAYSVVDAVQVGKKLFARKCIVVRRSQLRLREAIQKEIRIIQTVEHPHVIRVFLTYEETNRYCILMHPLADCDLETFLDLRYRRTEQDARCMSKWMNCLASSLAFVHSKDVRHKDIKPRNVLIKGEKIYLADFGSSHMFADDGISTTNGPASGYTTAYCAPEVKKDSDRNRKSDVFSLGCVFAEMFVWSQGIQISLFHEAIRPAGQAKLNPDERPSPLYHASCAKVRNWFRDAKAKPEGDPGGQIYKDFYEDVLNRMVRTEPDARGTAIEITQAISRRLGNMSPCQKCSIDVWVPNLAVQSPRPQQPAIPRGAPN